MKLLGIDYGTVRIGLAVSDESLMLARELDIVSPKDFFAKLPTIIKEQEISELVVGLPLNMSGQDTEKTTEARAFAEQLHTQLGLPVHLVDERLSSSMAEGIIGHNKQLDSMAAQIILQNYLNSLKQTS